MYICAYWGMFSARVCAGAARFQGPRFDELQIGCQTNSLWQQSGRLSLSLSLKYGQDPSAQGLM